MIFQEAYKKIKPSIVAVCGRVSRNPHFPDIIGTGVVVDGSGLILTNSHVVKSLHGLPRKKGAPANEWPAFCFLFHFIEGKGVATIPLDIVGVGGIEAFSASNYYGETPDIGFIRVNITNLPTAKIVEKFSLEEGEEVGIAGFPMGAKTLMAPGWVHQFGPTLKIAHIASILPFPCENPHAILIDSSMQGGNSGSPVFNKEGEIVGLLYGGLNDRQEMSIPLKGGKVGKIPYQVPTNLSYAVPNQIINFAIAELKKQPMYQDDSFTTSTFEEYLSSNKGKLVEPKVGNLFDEAVSEKDIERLAKVKSK